MNFRCNICGDTDINKHKKSAYILKRFNKKLGYDTWQFYCHRGSCGSSMLAEYWLERYYPTNYRSFRKDLLFSNNLETKKELEFLELESKKQELIDKEQKKIEELEDISFFIPIHNHNRLCDLARNYCKTRLIDEQIWSKWYVAVDGKYKNRMIIPFYNEFNEVYYWQGRSLFNYMSPKYLNRVDNRDEAIYNYSFIDKSKPVILLEGIIDSLFVKNSISVLGTNITEECAKKINLLDKYYLFDNDEPGFKKSLDYLIKGCNIFLWKPFLKDMKCFSKVKDINDLVIKDTNYIKMLNFENLQKYFTNNIFDKIYLK